MTYLTWRAAVVAPLQRRPDERAGKPGELDTCKRPPFHIHDAKLAWFKSIEDIHNRLLQQGGSLALQVDVTATPKHNNGAIFVQTVSDYPLVEAISQKHPVLPDAPSRAKVKHPVLA